MKKIKQNLTKHIAVPPHFYPENAKPNIFVRFFHSIIRLFKDKTSAAFIFSIIGICSGVYTMLAPPKVLKIETKVPVYVQSPEIKKVDVSVTGEVFATDSDLKLELTVVNKGNGGAEIRRVYFDGINQNIIREPITLNPFSSQKITLSGKQTALLVKKMPLTMDLSNGEKKEISALMDLPAELRSKMFMYVSQNKDKIVWGMMEDLTRDLNVLSSAEVKVLFNSINTLCTDLNGLKDGFKLKLGYAKRRKNIELQRFYSEMIHVINVRTSQCSHFNSLMIADIIDWKKNELPNYMTKFDFPNRKISFIHDSETYEVSPQKELAFMEELFEGLHMLWKNRDNKTFILLYSQTLKKS